MNHEYCPLTIGTEKANFVVFGSEPYEKCVRSKSSSNFCRWVKRVGIP